MKNYFKFYEIISPETYSKLIQNGFIKISIDNGKLRESEVDKRVYWMYGKILETGNIIREKVGSACICNNWHTHKPIVNNIKNGGVVLKAKIEKRQNNIDCYKGERPLNCPIGADMSSHKIRETGTIDLTIPIFRTLSEYDQLKKEVYEDENLNFIVEFKNGCWCHFSQAMEGQRKYLFDKNGKVYYEWID